jgi:DNA-binding beta-propeller fold protein YncE
MTTLDMTLDLVGNITVGSIIASISINPINNKVYALYCCHSISVIDGSKDKVVGNIDLGNRISTSSSSLIDSDPITGFIYATDSDSGHIYVIDTKNSKVLPGYVKI